MLQLRLSAVKYIYIYIYMYIYIYIYVYILNVCLYKYALGSSIAKMILGHKSFWFLIFLLNTMILRSVQVPVGRLLCSFMLLHSNALEASTCFPHSFPRAIDASPAQPHSIAEALSRKPLMLSLPKVPIPYSQLSLQEYYDCFYLSSRLHSFHNL